MSDPYRPAYYPSPATAGSPYYPPDYADSHDQYGPLTTRHRPDHSRNSSGYHSQVRFLSSPPPNLSQPLPLAPPLTYLPALTLNRSLNPN